MPKKSWPEKRLSNKLNADMRRLTSTQTNSSNQNHSYGDRHDYQPECNTVEADQQVDSDLLSEHPVEPMAISPLIYQGRRRKAAVVLSMIWGGTITLHLVSWGSWLILGLTGLLSIHALRILLKQPQGESNQTLASDRDYWPFVSLLVAAKNEESVIRNLVENLCTLDYPSDAYEVWVIDDQSTDNTPRVLDQLAEKFDHLKVLHRRNGGGGKSGALNQVLPLTQGEMLGVFDADAQVSSDLLRKVIPLFDEDRIGAVQMRKAISNASLNFWTHCQAAEMALDAFFQEQRIALGGIGELRGNGQFVRRSAIEACGGWNEETITDDLDLTIRLHLNDWDIEFLASPPVYEEGVTGAIGLWHQRNRWAEGGYQRYLDYWKPLLSNRLGTGKTLDLFGFLVMQYLVPTAAVPDLIMAGLLRRLPITSPLSLMAITLSVLGMFMGLRRIHNPEKMADQTPQSPNQSLMTWLMAGLQSIRGTLYMLHWFIVIGSTAIRISVRPKRLKWVKTVHQGMSGTPQT
ncbi:glycosyltransferase family 2 protein [Limnoraphis robusta Tam1]|uniref:glycosyltransferase n=1 Tax=Limnoraphis robusta TaxID=1118279 RepID=UPI002B21214E|nr:glycosyltransferase family 2 protein [Limnoraphis robusta]MEA5541507.1 glycosyltransferase family 2 protein [Limnoraphis robusta Tam1]